MNSMIAASWWWSAPAPAAPAVAWPDSTTSIGRRRLPPAETMCSATWLIRTTSEARRLRISASTAAMSAAARAWICGRLAGTGGADRSGMRVARESP